MDKDIEKIEADRRKREAALLLILLMFGLQSRRFVLHAVRLGSDPINALRRVWIGDTAGHFKGVVQPLAMAMAEAHIDGYLRASELVDEKQAAVTVDWRQYEPAARRMALLALQTIQQRLASALASENTPTGQIQAVRQAFMSGGWLGDKPAAMATLATGSVVSSYGAGMFAAAMDSAKVTGFVHRSVLDSATTLICEDRDGLTLPKGDAYWLTNFPPLHFNCRSLLMPVMSDGPWSGWLPTVPPMAGFGVAPISFQTRKAA